MKKWYKNPAIVIPSAATLAAAIILGGIQLYSAYIDRANKSPVKIESRNPNAIYQSGLIVGNVSGQVEGKDGNFIFNEIYNTSNLKQNLPFEYREEKYKIIKIGSVIGILVDISDNKTKTKLNVLKNVVYEKVK